MNLKSVIEVAVLVGAAFLEVGGDALIRRGFRGGGLAFIALGFAVLGSYGILVTMLELDFSKVLGAYVGFFAVVGVLFGWLVFGERVHGTTWIGLAVILVGSLIIQFGSKSETPRLTEKVQAAVETQTE